MNISFKTSVGGRHILSLWASNIFEKSGIKQLFGLNLVAAVLFTGIITPQASDVLSELEVENRVTSTPIVAHTTTETTYELPLVGFRISQLFNYWHPGIDMTAPLGTPVYAIEAGVVEVLDDTFFGYGKHVIVGHDRGIKSLYAHLSEFATFQGKQIARGELIGRVGSTGWSTGNHLHIEIHQSGLPINPFEVLPLNSQEVQYDRAFVSTYASPSAEAVITGVTVSVPTPLPSVIPTLLPSPTL